MSTYPRLTPQDVGIGQLFWSMRDAVVVADAGTGRIVLWNPAAAELFGHSETEALALLCWPRASSASLGAHVMPTVRSCP